MRFEMLFSLFSLCAACHLGKASDLAGNGNRRGLVTLLSSSLNAATGDTGTPPIVSASSATGSSSLIASTTGTGDTSISSSSNALTPICQLDLAASYAGHCDPSGEQNTDNGQGAFLFSIPATDLDAALLDGAPATPPYLLRVTPGIDCILMDDGAGNFTGALDVQSWLNFSNDATVDEWHFSGEDKEVFRISFTSCL